jgi:hypothetical protein
LALACAVAPAARAATSHPPLFSIFYFPSLLDAEYFEAPCGLAVRPDGGLYVADYYHDKIESFDAGGGYLSARAGNDGSDGPCGLAVDAAGDVFVNDFHGAVVREATPGVPETIDPGPATGVAYDPAGGRIYVDDRDHVAVYEESGQPVEVAGEPLRIGDGSLVEGFGVAVSGHPGSEGFVYVPDAATNTIKVFDPATDTAAPVAEIDGAGDPQGGFTTLRDAAVAVDDATGDLFVVYNAQGPFFEHPAAAVAEFTPAGEYRGSLPTGSLRFGEPSGIAVDDTGGVGQGRIFVTSGNSQVEHPAEAGKPQSGKREEGAVFAFGPTAPGARLAVAVSGGGTVASAAAGIACPGACAAEYDEGTTVTLAAAPATGEVFDGWSGGGCAGTGPCTVTMAAATAVAAEFVPAPTAAAHPEAQPVEPARPPGGSSGPTPGAAGPMTAASGGTTTGGAATVKATPAHRHAAKRHRHRRHHRHHKRRFRARKVRSGR